MPVTLGFRLVADGVTAAGLFAAEKQTAAGLVAADELTADRRGENSAARELRFESANQKKEENTTSWRSIASIATIILGPTPISSCRRIDGLCSVSTQILKHHVMCNVVWVGKGDLLHIMKHLESTHPLTSSPNNPIQCANLMLRRWSLSPHDTFQCRET